MKKIAFLITTILAVVSVRSFAQDEKIAGVHVGVKAGINIASITAKSSGLSFTPSSIVGPTGGFFASLPVGTGGFQIQPELLYSGLGYKVGSELAGSDVKATMGYLVLPVLAKYTLETVGFGAYIGPQVGYLLSAKSKSDGVTEDAKDGFKSTDFAGIIGVDYTFPMGFNLSARYQLGLSNIAKDTNGEGSVKNHAITFTVGYRFK